MNKPTTVTIPLPTGGQMELTRQDLLRMLSSMQHDPDLPFPAAPEEKTIAAQGVFDLVASLIEDINLRQDLPGSGVWDEAGAFCEHLRNQGIQRKRFACDYPNEEKDDV